jgi:DNA (cytosine-5)-methyltransferase 1
MRRPRLLDLFCGGGGASMGYHLAGFDVTGVDVEPQPRYPFTFFQADATTFPLDGFDVIAASPPCKDHTSLVALAGGQGTGWMLAHTIKRLAASGLPYVVENVVSPSTRQVMPGALVLCGTEFGLRAGGRWLRRHRRFLSNTLLMGAGGCHCSRRPIGGVYGTGGGGQMNRGFKFSRDDAKTAMGIDWMSWAELAQAIPPAYTRFIGEQLLAVSDRIAA